jgi:hypothetical protein
MSAAPNRFKQANAPLGLSPAALTLPAQRRTGRRAVASGQGTYSEPHSVGERGGHK